MAVVVLGVWSTAGATGDGSRRFDDGPDEGFDGGQGASEDADVEFDAEDVSICEIRHLHPVTSEYTCNAIDKRAQTYSML